MAPLSNPFESPNHPTTLKLGHVAYARPTSQVSDASLPTNEIESLEFRSKDGMRCLTLSKVQETLLKKGAASTNAREVARCAIESNCGFCLLLSRAKTIDELRQRRGKKINLRRKYKNGPLVVGIGSKMLEFYVHPSQPSPWPVIGVSEEDQPLSGTTLRRVHEWLHKCITWHDQCTKPSSTFMPKRLISVGSSDADLRICLTSPTKKANYVALSHRWGSTTPRLTTNNSLEYFETRIPAGDLPRTLFDAIQVTRWLSIPYLWIDTLCIIQDSSDDWAEQAGQMAKIFENSTVTIAAHAAIDSFSGFLSSTLRVWAPSESVSVFDEQNNTNFRMHVRQRLSPSHYVSQEGPWHLSSEDEQRSSLENRGWVYQEYVLAPRTLHFAPAELAWECVQKSECECDALTRRIFLGSTMKRKRNDDFTQRWTSLVETYSTKDLGYKTDRLPALSGVAEWMARRRPKDRYICGHWKSEVHESLLWYPLDRNHDRLFDKNYAPSWSWASVSGPISFDLVPEKDSCRIKVEDSYCSPGPNPYGPAPDAWLQLSALVVAIEPCSSDAMVEPYQYQYRRMGTPYQFISRDETRTKFEVFFDCLSYVEYISVIVPREILFLVFSMHWKPNGLVVRRSSDQHNNSYERIGIGYCFAPLERGSYPQGGRLNKKGFLALCERRSLKLV